MNKQWKKRAVIGVAVSLGVLAAIAVVHRDATRRGAELELSIAQMPLAITDAEAIAIVGKSPDRSFQQSGVLITPVTMLTANNSTAAAYGPSQNYTMHTWRRGYANATVAIDGHGKVAGRWTWR